MEIFLQVWKHLSLGLSTYKILILGLTINIALNFYFIPVDGINGAAKATLTSLIIWNSITTVFVYSRDKIKFFLT